VIRKSNCGYTLFLSDLYVASYISGVVGEGIRLFSLLLSSVHESSPEPYFNSIELSISNRISLAIKQLIIIFIPRFILKKLHEPSLLVTFLQLFFAIPLRSFTNFLFTIGTGLGILSIILATLPTFPDSFDKFFHTFGIDPEIYAASYRCNRFAY